MNTLYAGFSRVDITPMMGIGMAGFIENMLEAAGGGNG